MHHMLSTAHLHPFAACSTAQAGPAAARTCVLNVAGCNHGGFKHFTRQTKNGIRIWHCGCNCSLVSKNYLEHSLLRRFFLALSLFSFSQFIFRQNIWFFCPICSEVASWKILTIRPEKANILAVHKKAWTQIFWLGLKIQPKRRHW